jgi:hypothetical protein
VRRGQSVLITWVSPDRPVSRSPRQPTSDSHAVRYSSCVCRRSRGERETGARRGPERRDTERRRGRGEPRPGDRAAPRQGRAHGPTDGAGRGQTPEHSAGRDEGDRQAREAGTPASAPGPRRPARGARTRSRVGQTALEHTFAHPVTLPHGRSALLGSSSSSRRSVATAGTPSVRIDVCGVFGS